jgi:predicted negative regulator of RcsB-dependent stress response
MTTKQKLSSKITIFGLIILLAFLANWKYRQWGNENLIRKQKQSLQAQADALQKKNDELSQSLQYLNSDSFKESVARQQLNLKKQGEVEYAFTDVPSTAAGQQNQSGGSESNPKKWLDYFFSN